MAIVEGENYKTLLDLLKNPKGKIGSELLLKPRPRTRPHSERLVATYGLRHQLAVFNFSWGATLYQTAAVMSALYALANLLSQGSAKKILDIFLQNTTFGAGNWARGPVIFAGLLIFFLLVAFLRDKLTFFPGQLDFDLNGLYHLTPKGRCYTYWSKFNVVYKGWGSRIILYQEDGNYLILYIWSRECSKLVNLIEALLHRHRTTSSISTEIRPVPDDQGIQPQNDPDGAGSTWDTVPRASQVLL